MSVTAGALSLVSVASTTASVLSAAATAGTGPYTYQWYKSTLTGFTPGAGNLITGATSLALSDVSLIPGTLYFYKMVATDTGAGNATSTSSQLSVQTLNNVLAQNQFALAPYLGMPDLRNMGDVISVQIDVSQATPLIAGAAVKIVASSGGLPKVVGCSANSDGCIGFLNYDIKSQAFNAGDKAEMATSDAVIYLYATTAIPRFSRVTLDVTTLGGVGVLVASSGASIVGFAIDQAVVGQLIRVKLTCPTFAVA